LARTAAGLWGAGLLLWGGPAPAQQPSGRPQAAQAAEPAPDQLFRPESEATLHQRMRQEAVQRGRSVPEFPTEPAVSTQVFAGRAWPHQVEYAVPSYVCYNKLLFQQINAERYGWDLGPIHSIISGGLFFLDVALFPYNAAVDICNPCECSAGYCLPGDPVPLLLYLPEFSWTGLAAEAAAIGSLIAILHW
jgi:hypothetical protein